MKKENSVIAGYGVPTGRITRARSAATQENGGVFPSKLPIAKPDKKRTQREKTKRTTLDENSQVAPLTAALQNKKRAVLKDVTNICCENSYMACINAARMQSKVSQRVKLGSSKSTLCSGPKDSKLGTASSVGSAMVHDDAKDKMAEDIHVGMLESQGTTASVKVQESLLAPRNVENVKDGDSTCVTALLEEYSFREKPELVDFSKSGQEGFTGSDFVDIDSVDANPQMCSLYASDIYSNLRAVELIRRPCSNFLETLQHDITQSMRGILIDWLVEVSEEYKLVPDTLYLTVYIIDRFLSQNYIERQRLQLLGITCMLIASKYEEICAPRVEEFCFITDNTYTKGEVLRMESQVLKNLSFQLSVPTVKTFLRRFLRAAQAPPKVQSNIHSLGVPSLALGYLANYLAELTLVEYSFLKFLPSIIAASAVFLARWTLDQSDHPWNQTLEHYTSFKASDLNVTVLAIQELQRNSINCPLNAIREKYKQQKFECVAALTSPKLLQSLFC